jgi:hypothetical protein
LRDGVIEFGEFPVGQECVDPGCVGWSSFALLETRRRLGQETHKILATENTVRPEHKIASHSGPAARKVHQGYW